ncbi:MAG: hypothetical protein ACE5EX_02610, partial [Phycisphaerae bacterium]
NSTYRLTISCTAPIICNVNCLGTSESDATCGNPSVGQATSDNNGGCNFPPGVFFDSITCGETVCGTTREDNNGVNIFRDLDWFTLELTNETLVTYTVDAEFDLDFVFSDSHWSNNDCNNLPPLFVINTLVADCQPLVFSQCLAPGTYIILIAPTFDLSGNTTIACGASPAGPGQSGSHYGLTITCQSPCPPPQPLCGNGANDCQSPNLASGWLSDEDQGQVMFDDFKPSVTGTVSTVCAWGFEDDLLTPGGDDCAAADDFTVTYYATDGAGILPDLATIVGGPFSQSGATLTVTKIQEVAGTQSIFRYEMSHAPVNFTAGTCYWISIKQSNGECFCDWFWMVSNDGNGRIAANDSTGLTALASDLAWCVDLSLDPASCDVLGACCTPALVCTATNTQTQCLNLDPNNLWTPFEDCNAGFICVPPPAAASDSCAGAGDISGVINGAVLLSDNTFATPPQNDGGPGDPELPAGSPTCHWNGIPTDVHNTVWWTIDAPDGTNGTVAGALTIQTCNSPASDGTNFRDSIIALYDGTCGALVEIACAEDQCSAGGGGAAPDYFSSFSITGLTPGQTYILMVGSTGSWAGSNPGPFQLDVTSP